MADCGSNIREDDEVPGRVEETLCQMRVKEIMCQPCLSKDKKNVADKFCSTCNEFQCNDCSDVHNVLAVFKSHKLLNANVAHVIRCDEHQKVIDLFCEAENKLCCSTCAIVDHSKCHSVVEVEKLAGKMTSSSSSLEEILKEAKENAENIARDIISSKDQLVQDVEEIQAIIREMRDEVVKMFEELEKTDDYIEEPFITGLDFLPDGRLVAVDNNNMKLIVYDEKLEVLGSYQLSYGPLAIVSVSEDEVAITSGDTYMIDLLRVGKANEISSRRKYRVTTKYDSICLKDNSQFVVGTFDYQIPVEIISLAGEPDALSINFPNKAYQADTSVCTYIQNINKLVLTDIYKHTIYIYDIMTNTRVVVKDDHIQTPCGVAVGPSDTILVCSYGTDSIVQISQTGQILSSHKIDMKYPYRVLCFT
ncbi:uncharacterized protein LOC132735689 [Ruditapes philippinarum]|uniref:uncharacterized protein LOC132735689 n=1 Tax=Ruditapes philippinarum TaxID=129788 RepID=UPI00295BBFDD|nr:uncharacterized protein LOC132735689 [Ruditapes philippinarum]